MAPNHQPVNTYSEYLRELVHGRRTYAPVDS